MTVGICWMRTFFKVDVNRYDVNDVRNYAWNASLCASKDTSYNASLVAIHSEKANKAITGTARLPGAFKRRQGELKQHSALDRNLLEVSLFPFRKERHDTPEFHQSKGVASPAREEEGWVMRTHSYFFTAWEFCLVIVFSSVLVCCALFASYPPPP